MSFAEKFAGLMARPNQDLVAKDDVPWYLKYGGRVLGIVAAFFAIMFGVYNCLGIITINFSSVLSGMLQICCGFLVMVVEAPCCCVFIDHVQKIAEKADNRPYWNRAALYCAIAIPPIVISPGLASIFGCGLIFATGVVYGMMSLGKKASREDMAAMASSNAMSPSQQQAPSINTDQHSTLMEDPDVWRPTASVEQMRNAAVAAENGGASAAPRSGLVNNAQPISISGPPTYDSNV